MGDNSEAPLRPTSPTSTSAPLSRKPGLNMGVKSATAAAAAKREAEAVRSKLAPRSFQRHALPVALAADTDVVCADGTAAVGGGMGGARGAGGGSGSSVGYECGGRRGGGEPAPAPLTRSAVRAATSALLQEAQRQAAPLLRWLNHCGLLLGDTSPMVDWPEDCVARGGKPILDLIEIASGVLVPGRLRGADAAALPTSRRARAQLLFRQANDVLSWLKGAGAHVHGVRGECLLPLPDFLMVRKYLPRGVLFAGYAGASYAAPVTESGGGAAAKARAVARLTAAYPLLSHKAWTTVALQAVKLFVLERASLRNLIQGVPGTLLDAGNSALWRALTLAEMEMSAAVSAEKAAVRVMQSGGGVAQAQAQAQQQDECRG